MPTKKRVSRLRNDAEAFLSRDLSDLDVTQFKSTCFEFEKKTARVNMRLPEKLLKEVKARASARTIPYQRFIRESLERAVTSRK